MIFFKKLKNSPMMLILSCLILYLLYNVFIRFKKLRMYLSPNYCIAVDNVENDIVLELHGINYLQTFKRASHIIELKSADNLILYFLIKELEAHKMSA